MHFVDGLGMIEFLNVILEDLPNILDGIEVGGLRGPVGEALDLFFVSKLL